jgi:ABC-type transporter Mla MlaB component
MVQTPSPAGATSRPNFSAIANPDQAETNIRVTEFGHIDRMMWEANILYAMGRNEEVKSMAAAAKDKGSDAGYQLSLAMLRMAGDKDAFEDLAVEYAVQTGNSPPVWLDVHEAPKAVNSAPKRIGVKVASLLMENIIETTIKMESPWPLELDFSEVTKMDAAGLDIFQESLAARISREENTKLIGIEKILKNVSDKIKSAPVDGNQGLWTFCLNANRLLGAKAAFEELANEFAQKSGDDIPVWKDLRDEEEINPPSEAPAPVAVGHKIGDSLSAVEPSLLRTLSTLKSFKEAKDNRTAFALDFSRIRRWTITDVASVIVFLQQGTKEGVSFELLNINEMLFALLKGFGVDKRARLVVAGDTI